LTERTETNKRTKREPKKRSERERARKTSSADNVPLQHSSWYEAPLNTFITGSTHIYTKTDADKIYIFLSASLS
jgi:hypothetical protein